MADTYTNIADAAGRWFTCADGYQAYYAKYPSARLTDAGDKLYYYAGQITSPQVGGKILYASKNWVSTVDRGAFWLNTGQKEYINDSRSIAEYNQLNKEYPWFAANKDGQTVFYPFTEQFYVLTDGSYLSYSQPTSVGAGGQQDTGGSGAGSGGGDGTGDVFNPLGQPIGLGGGIYNFITQLAKQPLTWLIVVLLLITRNEKTDK